MTGRCPIITRDMDMKHRIPSGGYLRCAKLRYRRLTSRDLEKYTKFVVFRHPMDRLLSAYHDKAFIHKTKDGRVIIYKKYEAIVKYSMKKQNFKRPYSKKKIRSHFVPFVDFVEFMLENDDKHWQSYAKKCGLCHIDYDFIMRTESLEPDSGFFLSKYYPTTSMLPSFNHLQQGNISQHFVHEETLNEFDALNAILINRVMKKYQLDFEMLGYDFDTESYTATCEMNLPGGDTCC